MGVLKRNKSVRGDEVRLPELAGITYNFEQRGYDKPKWIHFCEVMLMNQYRVWVYRASNSVSKYVTVLNPHSGNKFRIRFSNHKPRYDLEHEDNCDFFVGRNNNSVSTTDDAIAKTLKALGAVPE